MRIQSFPDINFSDHHLVGLVWTIESSRTGEMYKVEMTNLGFSCNCVAGSMRGKCKHAQHVHDLLVSDDVIKYEVA
jgi:hypothetical protein